MPFGLKNAPSTFQRMIDNVLREHISNICLINLDYIVFSMSFEHITNFNKIFQTLRNTNLKVQLDKKTLNKGVLYDM